MLNSRIILLVSAVILSCNAFGQAHAYEESAYNPFKKPKVIVQKTGPNEKEIEKSGIDINMVAGLINGGSSTSYFDPLKDNPYINAGLLYKGTTNGVDIFYDEDTKRYIKDSSRVIDIDIHPEHPPEFEKINY